MAVHQDVSKDTCLYLEANGINPKDVALSPRPCFKFDPVTGANRIHFFEFEYNSDGKFRIVDDAVSKIAREAPEIKTWAEVVGTHLPTPLAG